MTFLPIVDRELRVAARLTGTYKKRALAAALVAVVAMAMMLFGNLTSSRVQVGGAMFGTLSYMLLAFCLLEGARKTADCLSEERREGTLGLLFLTDLKGYDIILGKLAATSLTSIYGLLAMLPILALSLLLGGVTQGEFWRRALALTSILFFSLSAGIWVSARSRSERRALVGTLWVMVLFLVVPPLTRVIVLSHFNPAYPFFHSEEAVYRSTAQGYWQSLFFTQLISWLLLAWASFSVSRLQADEVLTVEPSRWREWWQRFEFGDAEKRAQLRSKLLEHQSRLLAGRPWRGPTPVPLVFHQRGGPRHRHHSLLVRRQSLRSAVGDFRHRQFLDQNAPGFPGLPLPRGSPAKQRAGDAPFHPADGS